MVSSLVVMAAAAMLQPPACDALKSIPLSRVTITAAEFVAAGAPAPGRGRRDGDRSAARLRDSVERYRPQRRDRAVCRRPSREDDRLRLSRDARDGSALQ